MNGYELAIAMVALALIALAWRCVVLQSRCARAEGSLEQYNIRLIELYQWLSHRPLAYAPLEYLMMHVGLSDQVQSSHLERRLTDLPELRKWLDEHEAKAIPGGLLTVSELNKCHQNPDVLRAIADEHEVSSMEVESIGEMLGCANFHGARARELRAEALRIEESYE